MTIDIDIVADLRLEHVPLLVQFFSSPEYYVSETAIRDAIARRFQFNVIHPASGLKADVFIPKQTDYATLEAQRVKRLSNPGEYDAWFSSAEDVVLNKLLYFQLSGGVSDKHIRDIVGIMKLQGNKIDRCYLMPGPTSSVFLPNGN